ncbi:MAG: cation:proton antiporter [Planctomycetota bacterium]|nr:cation:proton antiporter [Planctomycetota bacterium]
MIESLTMDLCLILIAAFLSGLVCRKLGASPVVGYLLVGAFIGRSGFGAVSENRGEIEILAHGGVLLLLFSIGLEFPLDKAREWLSRFVLGGSTQMLLVVIPLVAGLMSLGLNWRPAAILGTALAFSSTVLVFRALSEIGQATTPHGRSIIGILLFQDVALVPILLLVPQLSEKSRPIAAIEYVRLAAASAAFILGILLLRKLMLRVGIELLVALRSTELVVLFMMAFLFSISLIAHTMGLTAIMGAFGAGLVLSGNRLTPQMDALVLPFRECFAALFFTSLGMLLNLRLFWSDAVFLVACLADILALKWLAGWMALVVTGSEWHTALGMGLGISQVGEFSFILALQGLQEGLLTEVHYQRVLCLSLGTLVLTPQLLRYGLRLIEHPAPTKYPEQQVHLPTSTDLLRAIVVGIAPAGRQIASRLELAGYEVCVVDLSPVNVYPFTQEGFRAVTGDATDPSVLDKADIKTADLVVVCVPRDEDGIRIVRSARLLNRDCRIMARCHYLNNTNTVKKAGANVVISEEGEALNALLKLMDEVQSYHETRQT